jgi:hypothetical protein
MHFLRADHLYMIFSAATGYDSKPLQSEELLTINNEPVPTGNISRGDTRFFQDLRSPWVVKVAYTAPRLIWILFFGGKSSGKRKFLGKCKIF